MKHSKCSRLLALLLALVMVIGMMPTVAFAEEAEDVVVAAEGPDNQTTSGDTTSSGEGTTNEGTSTNVAKIGDTEYATLQEAINAATDGVTITVLVAGEYTLDGNLTYTGKAFTIEAANGVDVTFDMSAAVALHGAKITFNGVTFDYKTNGNYIGIQHADTLVYNNCTIKGMVFLYAVNETFNSCKFYQDSADAYNVWTYGAQKVEFNHCTFNCAGKSVLVYNEGAVSSTDLTVTDTEFKASAPVAGKAAIEIDTSRMKGQTKITVDQATADQTAGFGTGSKSGNSLWNDKMQTADNNKNTTVIVADKTVFEPVAVAMTADGTKHATLADAFAALSPANHTLTLLDESAWNAATPVYWAAGSDKGYAATLKDALTAAYKANKGDITIVCRPGADVGSMTHGHVADNLTIYGNKAYISGGECDLEVDTYKYSRETGKQVNTGNKDNAGSDLTDDSVLNITAYELGNLGVWGQRFTKATINVSLTDCDGNPIVTPNVQRVYISGTTGENNITLTGCDFLTAATAVYSNADGKITIDNCSFTGGQVPVNFNHKATGTQTVTVSNSKFENCGDNGGWKQFAAPIRFVNSGSGTMNTEVDTCIITGTVGANGDILIGDGRTGQASNDVSLTVRNTAATVQAQQPGYYTSTGTVADASKKGEKAVTKEQTLTTSVTELTTSTAQKGTATNPYTREDFEKMTRAEYIAAQEKLGGTMYVKLDAYTYEKDGVLGNGVRNDTPGQTPDHSKLNAYGENGYLGAQNDGANGKNIVFVGGTITSGVTGYKSIDNIGTSLLLAVPAYTNVTFEKTTFKNVISFNYQLYTSPWSQMGELKFDTCTFDGIIVGAIAAQTLSFTGCTFNDYTNTDSANSSNPTWIRPAYGNWTKADNEGQGVDFRSLTSIVFENNKVTSTRPVKFERIGQWETTTTVTVTDNTFDISKQGSETSTKNVGLYFGANAKFTLVADNNTKSDNTAALYTAVYSGGDLSIPGLPAGSTVTKKDGSTATLDAYEWNSTTPLTLQTTVANVNAKGSYVGDDSKTKNYDANFATLADALAAVKGTATVTLLSDLTESKTATVPAGTTITLDLNGKKLSTSNRADDPTKHYYAIDNYGTFTLKDSSTEQSGEIRARGIENLEGGTMVIESGKIVAVDTNGGAAIWNVAGADLTIQGGTFVADYAGASNDEHGPGCVFNKGTLTISGGTFTSANKRTYAVVSKSGTVTIDPAEGKNVTISGAHGGVGIDGGTATINGGSYASSEYYGLYVSNDEGTATVIVNGGTFKGKEYSVLIGSDGPQAVTSKLTITDGTFNKPIHAQENTGTGAIQVSGGTFSDPVNAAYCANGFIPTSTTENGVTTYGVVKGSYVASVTTADGAETKYATLQAAVAAAKDGETVKLLGDVTLDATLIVKEKTLTLDLNGKTITNEKDLWNETNYTWSLISVRDNGNLTIKDSVGTGKLKAKANDCFALDVYAYNKANAETTTLTIESGEYIGNSSAIYAFVGKVTINGGHFSIQQLSSSNDYRFMLNCYDESHTAGRAGFTVNGGTFDHFDPRNNLAEGEATSFVAEGVGVDANSDGTFTAKPNMIAQIIDAKGNSKMAFGTLQEAVKAVGETNTIKLLADTKENVTISKSRVTLDLNGYTLNGGTEKGKPALTVTAMNTVVKDSSAAHTGTIMREDTAENSGVSSHYVIDVQGKSWLTFESGNVTNDSGNGQNTKGAALVRVGSDSVAKYPGLTIKDGTFTQDNFIVIKVERGNFSLNGGTLSSNNYAIQNWHHATVKGGTVKGLASSWTYGSQASDLTISGGTVNGDVYSVNYNNATPAAKVAINGGTVNGKMYTCVYDEKAGTLNSTNDATKATIEVTGGTFKNDPSVYVVESATATKNDDGSYSVAEAYLASVGGTSYYTMKEAVEAQTTSGKDIVLLRDYTTGSPFRSGISARVVDLNGHTWTCTGTGANSAAFEISNPNASLTVKNGKIVSSQLVGLIPSAMGGTTTYDNSSLTFEGVEMTTTATSGIETNGNNTNDSVTLKDSTLNVPDGFGIYFPSSGTLTIDNSTINAKTMGVQLCAGSLNINEGSAITVSGDALPKAEGDGAIQDGAAISIVNRSGYKGLGTITVTGGKFTAKGDNAAIKAYDYADMNESKFTKPETVSVSGGTFSSPVDETLCKVGYIPTTVEGGGYGVKPGSYVASVTTADGVETKYETLQAAINAAEANDTVKLLADTKEDVTISKNITLDLGDKTLTNDNSNASQSTLTIAAGATATVKNGSIIGGTGHYNIAVGTEAQPGGELTLENVTATAGNTGSSMIDNWGTLTINSGTYTGGLNVVKSEEGSYLTITGGKFELNYAKSNEYNGVILSAGMTKITGGEFIQSATTPRWGNPQVVLAMVVEGYPSKVEITGGTFTNKKSGSNIFHGSGKATSDNFEVKGGTFNKEIPEGYCAEGYIPAKTTVDGKTVYGVKEGTYVAQVVKTNGSLGNKYETLAAAITGAGKNQTVKLLADTELKADLAVGKTLTLDLNGKTIETAGHKFDITGNLTITGNGTINNAKAATARNNLHIMLYVETNGKLTIENGTFTTMAAQIVYTKGSATIKNGTFENVNTNDDDATTEALNAKSLIAVNGTSASLTMTGGKVATKCEYLYGVFIQEGGKAVFGDAETKEGPSITTNRYAAIGENNTMATADITIYGGDYTVSTTPASDAWAPYCAVIYASASGSINIHDGTFTGYYIISDRYQKVEQTVTITGGTFNGTAADLYVTSEGGSGTTANRTIGISGGKFTHKVDEKYCALGYQPTEKNQTTGMYGVEEVDGNAAYVNSEGKLVYGDLLTLINDKTLQNVTIKMIKDVNCTSYLYLAADKTIDLNGKTLTIGGELFGFGEMIDSTEGNGLLKVTADFKKLPSENPSLPVYDTEAVGYRLYSYTMEHVDDGYKAQSDGRVMFAFSITFSNKDAWSKIASDDNSVSLLYNAKWIETSSMQMSFMDANVNGYATDCVTNNANICYFWMTVGGLEVLDGATLNMTPTLNSAFFTRTIDAAQYTPTTTEP